jgi:GNAT superfamily N-acetyltransferase
VLMENHSESLHVRTMSRGDLDLAIDWAADEGWNPGLNDADCFFNTDPEGFAIAELDGRPVGSVSVVVYDDAFGFLGFYMVVPQHRRKGIGKTLWLRALHALGDRNVGLDGMVGMQGVYTNAGFSFAHKNARYEGIGGGEIRGDLSSISDVPFEALLDYDARHFPARRETFLRKWIAQPNAHAYAALENGNLVGYGLMRPCRRGHRVGPLFADSPEIAGVLFDTLATHAPGAPVAIDVPEPNSAAIELAQGRGMKKSFETVRMYSRETPDLPLGHIFGLTSFELG